MVVVVLVVEYWTLGGVSMICGERKETLQCWKKQSRTSALCFARKQKKEGERRVDFLPIFFISFAVAGAEQAPISHPSFLCLPLHQPPLHLYVIFIAVSYLCITDSIHLRSGKDYYLFHHPPIFSSTQEKKALAQMDAFQLLLSSQWYFRRSPPNFLEISRTGDSCSNGRLRLLLPCQWNFRRPAISSYWISYLEVDTTSQSHPAS